MTRQRQAGFTLVELLVVIVIVAVLASLILAGLAAARVKAQQTQCSSNLHQFILAWIDYRGQNTERTPDWLSSLYPEYTSSKELYVCPADFKNGKIDGSKPQELLDWHESISPGTGEPFDETDDNKGRNGIDACSYFYEMCNAACTLSDRLPGETWAQYKLREVRGVADLTKFPVIRCYHHWKNRKHVVHWYMPDGSVDPEEKYEGLTINASWSGNVFFSPECWKPASVREM